jgi:predicted DNA-binding protein
MPLKKKSADDQNAQKTEKYLSIPSALTKTQVESLDEIAKEEGTTRSEIIRQAIQTYIDTHQTEKFDRRESKLERRIQHMEDGLRSLLVKSIRLQGQSLYYQTLPYTMGGLPQRPVDQKTFNLHWYKSSAFSNQFLKAKTDQLPAAADQTETTSAAGNDKE